jgi:hypothetical protein
MLGRQATFFSVVSSGVSFVLASAAALGACSPTRAPAVTTASSSTSATGHAGEVLPEGDVPSTLTYLDQGWSPGERDAFYYTSQGSEVMPYRWFLALEQVASEQLFSDREHLEGFGWVYGEDSADNPDRLPVGFTRSSGSRQEREAVLGFNCSGCHTNDIVAGGRRVRIDGGPSLVDFGGFVHALAAAVSANLAPDKWERFSERMLGPGAPPARAAALHAEYAEFAAEFAGKAALLISQELAGFGRFDALTDIINALSVLDLGVPENIRPLSAPVSYPQLWLVTELDWVQWVPLASNPIARNTGEVLGVFGSADFRGPDPRSPDPRSPDPRSPDPRRPDPRDESRYASTVQFENLHALESWLSTLQPPRWDESLFGAIDTELGKKGERLFQRDCRSCHNMPPYDRTDPAKNIAKRSFIETTAVPTAIVGTDDVYSKTLFGRVVKTGPLAEPLFGGKTLVPAASFFLDTVAAVTRKGLEKMPPAVRLAYSGYRFYPAVGGAAPEPYRPHEPARPNGSLDTLKAGPLLGIWATGPFLHNGSVPTLYELLSPPSERSKVFWVGSRELDAKHLGFRSIAASRHFRFDTALRGNDNLGHDYPAGGYGPDDRLAVLEFLKDPLRFLPTSAAAPSSAATP